MYHVGHQAFDGFRIGFQFFNLNRPVNPQASFKTRICFWRESESPTANSMTTKRTTKRTLRARMPPIRTTVPVQITDNQESIIEIQDTPMEGQEHEGVDKRSTEERYPSISQELSPTKKSKRQTQPPPRMLDYEPGEATAWHSDDRSPRLSK